MLQKFMVENSEVEKFMAEKSRVEGPWLKLGVEKSVVEMSFNLLRVCHIYSRVHISLDEVFSKILKKPSIMQK